MKRILIFHYHLNPGGVTRIIESQVKILRKYYNNTDIIVFASSCDNPRLIEGPDAKLILFEPLNYLQTEHPDPIAEYNILKNFFESIIRKEDILHFHNLNLGKNPILTLVVSDLAKKGFKVLNHAHDFSEDRPQNQNFHKNIIEKVFHRNLKDTMYPGLPNYLFAVLNSSDKERLIKYGISSNRLYLLPNPVDSIFETRVLAKQNLHNEICSKLQLDRDKKIVTYPVRVIRRKNIGEFILHSILFNNEANWLVTQPPKNPEEIIFYEKWKEFCNQNNIKIIFEAGNKVEFEKLVIASDFCITTSTREGFGMTYMEPWLAETPVIGRDLITITRDLKMSGMIFSRLYKEIRINYRDQEIDFAILPDHEQQDFLRSLINNRDLYKMVFNLNPFLFHFLEPVEINAVQHNKSIILKEYSLENYARRLKEIYQKFT